jgi:hypothetical protein
MLENTIKSNQIESKCKMQYSLMVTSQHLENSLSSPAIRPPTPHRVSSTSSIVSDPSVASVAPAASTSFSVIELASGSSRDNGGGSLSGKRIVLFLATAGGVWGVEGASTSPGVAVPECSVRMTLPPSLTRGPVLAET